MVSIFALHRDEHGALSWVELQMEGDMGTGVGVGVGLPYLDPPAGSGTENLFPNSEDMTQSSWFKNQSSYAAGKLTENTATNLHYIANLSLPVDSGVTYTASIYAIPAGRSWFRIAFGGTGFGSQGVFFDATNGVVGTVQVGAGNLVDYGISDEGGGEYRCWVAVTADTTDSVADVRFDLADADSSASYTGDGTSGMQFRQPQFEVGSSPTTYTPSA